MTVFVAVAGWAGAILVLVAYVRSSFSDKESAEYLRERGALLVGINSHNIDDTRTRSSRPVHTILLGHDILIVEHMRGLEQLPDSHFRFSAIPPKIKGMGTFPVRAFAEIG